MIGRSPPQVDEQPGCGLGVYAAVLLILAAISTGVMVMASMGLLFASPTGPSELVPGGQVAVWRLQPMRDAGLLELTQVPLAWHDESFTMNGTTACALTAEALVRVEDGVGTRLPYAEFTGIHAQVTANHGAIVTASGATAEVPCHFKPREGAERFLAQIEAEAGLTAVVQGSPQP